MKKLLRNTIYPLFKFIPVLPNSLKYGKVYNETLSFLRQSENWSKEHIELWQIQQVKKLLFHSYETVPYYTKLFKDIGFQPHRFNELSDFKKIPYLTKDIIKENLQDLISSKYKDKLKKVTTGGSTGNPMGFFWQKGFTDSREQAFLWFLWNKKGIKESDKFVILRGTVPPKGKIIHYYRKNRLLISTYQINEASIPLMISKLESYRPDVIQGYPSALYLIAKWMNNNSYVPPYRIKAILTSSENLFKFQEDLFVKIFEAQVYDLYGNTERTALINKCVDNNYHINSFYGIAELEPVGNRMYEIISTSFNNYAMPFLRYKTEDLVTRMDEDDCSCGSHMNMVRSIEGRTQEFVYTSNGSKVTLTALVFGQHLQAFNKINRIQIIQNIIGKIDVHITINKKMNFSAADKTDISTKMKKACNGDIDVSVSIVNFIALTSRGKHKFFIQNIPF